jgi:cytochrome c553
VMAPLMRDLNDREMRDLSLYYAYLPRPRNEGSHEIVAVPSLVTNGSPMRNIAPCESCHNAGYIRAATPYLEGQPYAYLRGQLFAFKSNARRNDLNQQMRNVVRQMTLEEIDAVARYYASR